MSSLTTESLQQALEGIDYRHGAESAADASVISETSNTIQDLIHFLGQHAHENNLTVVENSTVGVNETLIEVADDDDEPSVAAALVSNVFLFFLIFGLSATVDVKSLNRQLHNRFALGTGVLMQFVVMPLLGFLAVLALRDQDGFSEAMGLTLLVVTSSPGGSYSNWWCSLFNADLALSVAMTAVSTILSIGMLPANLLLYSHLAYGIRKQDDHETADGLVQALDFGALFISLGVVIGAILLGLYCSSKYDNKTFHRWANRGASISGLALILVSVFLSSGSDSKMWDKPWTFYLGTALPCMLGISVATILARSFLLPRPEVIAIAIECCYQNTGIATSVAVTMFKDPTERAQAVAIPLFYGIVEALIIGIYCVFAWKAGWTKAPADENICTVISTSYEVDHAPETRNNSPDGSPSALPTTRSSEVASVTTMETSDLPTGLERPRISSGGSAEDNFEMQLAYSSKKFRRSSSTSTSKRANNAATKVVAAAESAPWWKRLLGRSSKSSSSVKTSKTAKGGKNQGISEDDGYDDSFGDDVTKDNMVSFSTASPASVRRHRFTSEDGTVTSSSVTSTPPVTPLQKSLGTGHGLRPKVLYEGSIFTDLKGNEDCSSSSEYSA